jgi:hypothetical protein
MAPQVEAPPPAALQPVDAYPRPVYPPGFVPPQDGAPTITDRIIPTKNPKALIAYYSGVFSLVPCFTPLLGPLALILGILGLNECKRHLNLPGKGHAITGIVLGSITTLIMLVLIGIVAWAAMNQPNRS